MPWDLDDLEDDDDFGEMAPEVRAHLDSFDNSGVKDASGVSKFDFEAAAPEQSPIIFLNVDGVLHPREALHDECLGEKQLAQLRRIVDASRARIVLSSKWRLDTTTLQRVADALRDSGVRGFIGATPNLEGEFDPNVDREKLCTCEILSWLEENEELVDPDRWVAIDDVPLDLETEDGVNHAVMADCTVGLTADVADTAILKLTDPGETVPTSASSN